VEFEVTGPKQRSAFGPIRGADGQPINGVIEPKMIAVKTFATLKTDHK